jgi:hypothetical protein
VDGATPTIGLRRIRRTFQERTGVYAYRCPPAGASQTGVDAADPSWRNVRNAKYSCPLALTWLAMGLVFRDQLEVASRRAAPPPRQRLRSKLLYITRTLIAVGRVGFAVTSNSTC